MTYDQIVSSIEDYHTRQVARLIAGHIGAENAITKDAIADVVFGGGNEHNTADANTRKVRVIIASLRELGMPIVSTSTAAGYFLAANTAEAEPMLSEMKSRIAKLQAAVNAIERALAEVEQPRLF